MLTVKYRRKCTSGPAVAAHVSNNRVPARLRQLDVRGIGIGSSSAFLTRVDIRFEPYFSSCSQHIQQKVIVRFAVIHPPPPRFFLNPLHGPVFCVRLQRFSLKDPSQLAAA